MPERFYRTNNTERATNFSSTSIMVEPMTHDSLMDHCSCHGKPSDHSENGIHCMSCQKPVRRMALPPGMTAKNHRRHFAQHNYHDHANDVCEESSCEGGHGKTATYKQATTRHRIVGSSSRGGVTTPFPLKLHEMLEGIAKDGLSSIVAWQPHGRSFVVHDPQKFVHEVMPCYFKQTKLSSFQRQLNLYGFSRITTGKDKGAYYHELFLRGHPVLCRKMMRTRIKGTGVRTASSPDTEPNFYLMPPVVQGDIIGKLGNMGPQIIPPSPSHVAKSSPVGKSSSPPTLEIFVPKKRVKRKKSQRASSDKGSEGFDMPSLVLSDPKLENEPTPELVESSMSTSSPNLIVPEGSGSNCSSVRSSTRTKKRKDDDEVVFEGRSFHYLDFLEKTSKPPLRVASTCSSTESSDTEGPDFELPNTNTDISIASGTRLNRLMDLLDPDVCTAKITSPYAMDVEYEPYDDEEDENVREFLADVDLPLDLGLGPTSNSDNKSNDKTLGNMIMKMIEEV
uniref:HSF-type DNA-binding domain-containing protein n=1 Tax=Attheya septentrionalis TaxID=420275 RepID=A0A7S2URE0_9STRA|mmetsp:Transcript_7609/g.13731  ORF Transcript_7609/g.13731 Transcript_7609/m.13731 type:complete len:507 (+) Transcript_7609:233-1753(+)|eukprot:CAMPEP_0198288998 /NCGR_PEP_ID=MMETSP1449-20131203/7335_1 /TAXON_ID=420275 /ORGANISM="Attheya septentrionalis, Strain CCMP2084" /LENGTH=506 /DNA_ID=CAMNT_0043987253 /DNA_START=105 /DNA_END=1625 /DNA_ORIENTATION=+